MKTFVVIKAQFEAIHQWEECPISEVDFLRQPHRHIFHVTVKFKVGHNNRELEFIVMKHKLEDILAKYNRRFIGNKSCEMLAEEIMLKLDADFVSVYEDDENGAEVVK
jgi:6-pyruvoyl-tetrahydropterin synthase